MGDVAVISRQSAEETSDPLNMDAPPSARLIIGAGYRGQYFIVEEIGPLMRVIAGPFSSAEDASEAYPLLRGQLLRNAS